MKKIFFTVLIGLLSVPTSGKAGFAVGMGGDPIPIALEYAKRMVAEQMLTIDMAQVDIIAEPQVAFFLKENLVSLATNLKNSPLELSEDHFPGNKCMWTNTPGRGETIFFNIDDCVKKVTDSDTAASLLVHEATHHFGKDDETFCNQVGSVVVQAIRRTQNYLRPSWNPIAASGQVMPGRILHSAIWTGHTENRQTENQMIVFGGCVQLAPFGACQTLASQPVAFSPATSTWQNLTTTDAPAARQNHTAVFTEHTVEKAYEQQMIVWGGCTDGACLNSVRSGARYDVNNQKWLPLPDEDNAPAARIYHSGMWVESKMFVWGGQDKFGFDRPVLGTGGLFDAKTETWTPTSSEGQPSGRIYFTATRGPGSLIFVWGGCQSSAVSATCPNSTNTGAIFDTEKNIWLPMEVSDNSLPPSPRFKHSAVWTGRYLIIWGGQRSASDFESSGAAYDFVDKSWKNINPLGASGRAGHTAIWNGEKMIVVGGFSRVGGTRVFPNDVGEFIVTSDLLNSPWKVFSNYPMASRDLHSAIWTDSELFIWGGRSAQSQILNQGVMFGPLWK